MFQRAIQPAYGQLARKSFFNHQLINQKLIKNFNRNIDHQKRFFIKEIIKSEGHVTLKIFTASLLTGIGVIYLMDEDEIMQSNTQKIPNLVKDLDSLNQTISDNKKEENLIGNYIDALVLDKLKTDKVVTGKNKIPGKRLILLQYRNCPFCCKVKTFLDYYGIPHEIVEVNPLTRKQLKFSKYRKVPILLIEDEKLKRDTNQIIQLNDSSSIISVLATYLFCNPGQKDSIESIINKYEFLQYTTMDRDKKVKETSNKYFLLYGESIDEKEYKSIEDELLNEHKFRKWTDEVFVHVLSPNIYRTTKEALQAFNWFSEVSQWENVFSKYERLSVIYIGGLAMYLISKYLKKKYHLKDDVRQSLYDECNYFLKGKGNAKEFMGGSKPNLSDLSVFGALSSIEGCDAFKDLTQNTKISTWYFKMKQFVEQSKGSDLLKI